MRETFVIIGLIILASALRSAGRDCVRKLGALCFLFTSFMIFYYLSGVWWMGLVGVALWFFLPWVELLTRVRQMRLPLENRLHHRMQPPTRNFPHAEQILQAMEHASFQKAAQCEWTWAGMQQHYCIRLHDDSRTVALLCLCEQADVAFSYVNITSVDSEGRIIRTTNYPFSPTFKNPPRLLMNHVPCRKNCFTNIWNSHQSFVAALGLSADDLLEHDVDSLDCMIEEEMEEVIEFNLEQGIIEFSESESFCYSRKGLFYLWGQFVKDMVKLC